MPRRTTATKRSRGCDGLYGAETAPSTLTSASITPSIAFSSSTTTIASSVAQLYADASEECTIKCIFLLRTFKGEASP